MENNNDEKGDFFIFKDMAFLFIPFGLNLTKKRIDILSTNVKKKGGKIMILEDFGWDVALQDEVFVVVSQDLTKDVSSTYYSENM